jgi:hypothetical protein
MLELAHNVNTTLILLGKNNGKQVKKKTVSCSTAI